MGQPRKIRNYEPESHPSEPMEVDDRGRLIISMLKEAQARMERTRRAAEESDERTKRLECDVKQCKVRAQIAESWMARVQEEIQDIYSEFAIRELVRLVQRGTSGTDHTDITSSSQL